MKNCATKTLKKCLNMKKKEENILWYEFLYEKMALGAKRKKNVSFLMGREFLKVEQRSWGFFSRGKNLCKASDDMNEEKITTWFKN